jgi:hypothetical protein
MQVPSEGASIEEKNAFLRTLASQISAGAQAATVLSDDAHAAAPPHGDEHKRKRDASNNPDQHQLVRLSVVMHTHSSRYTRSVLICLRCPSS